MHVSLVRALLFAWIGIIFLGALVTAPSQAADEIASDLARALAEIKQLGGRAETDGKAAGCPVVKVVLTRTKVDDAKLAIVLKGLPRLQVLDLEATNIKDAGLASLRGLADLKRLSLINTEITDAGLTHLKGLVQLQALDLSATKTTDAGLSDLAGLANLRELGLGLTKITDQGLGHLKTLTHLRKLDLFLTKVTDEGVRALRKKLPRVEVSR